MATDSKWVFAQVICLLIVGSVHADDIPGSSTVNIPSDYINYPHVGTAYKFHREFRTWDEAKRSCTSEGGRLTVTDNFLKFVQLTQVVESSDDAWVGLSKNGSQWLAVDGSTPAQIPWGTLQPTDSGDCAVYRPTSRDLSNIDCFWRRKFVCEIVTGTPTFYG